MFSITNCVQQKIALIITTYQVSIINVRRRQQRDASEIH